MSKHLIYVMEGDAADNTGGNQSSPALVKSPPTPPSASAIIDTNCYLKYEYHTVFSSSRPGVECQTVSLEGFLEDSSESDNGQFDFAFSIFQKRRQAHLARPPQDSSDGVYSSAFNGSTQGMWSLRPPSLSNLHTFIIANLHRRFKKCK